MKSNETIIFNDSRGFPKVDFKEYNIVDMRSNVYDSTNYSYKEKAKRYLNMLEKTGNVFFVANFSAESKYWDEEEELKKDGIYIIDIDKELHKDLSKLHKYLNDTLKAKEASEFDLVHLGGVPHVMKQI